MNCMKNGAKRMRNKNKKAFTLIEVLISATIFAIVMVIVAMTLSWASAYNARLTEMRIVGNDARKIMNMISDDIRQANGSVNITYLGTGGATSVEVGEFLIVNCSSNSIDSCIPKINYQTSYETDIDLESNFNNGLYIINKNENKIIYYRSFSNRSNNMYGDLKRFEADYRETININDYSFGTLAGDEIINSSGVDINMGFTGYTPTIFSREAQPFIKIMMLTKTEDYDNLTTEYKAKIELETTITSREYNIFK